MMLDMPTGLNYIYVLFYRYLADIFGPHFDCSSVLSSYPLLMYHFFLNMTLFARKASSTKVFVIDCLKNIPTSYCCTPIACSISDIISAILVDFLN